MNQLKNNNLSTLAGFSDTSSHLSTPCTLLRETALGTYDHVVKNDDHTEVFNLDSCLSSHTNTLETTDTLKLYMRQVAKNTLLSAATEHDLAKQSASGCSQARDKMIKSNLRLVVKWARDYRFHGIPFIDLIEEGNLGLIRAVDKFNPYLGYRFSTYASWWIRQAMDRAVMNQERMVRLPFHVVRELKACQKARRQLLQINGTEPTNKQIACYLGKSEKKVKSLLYLCEKIVSLDSPVTSATPVEKPSCLAETIASPIQQSPEFVATIGDLVELLNLWINQLDNLEKEIICSRFGLQGHQPTTLEKLGARLGMTRERVRQIQLRTLLAMRDQFSACGLQHIDLLDYEF